MGNSEFDNDSNLEALAGTLTRLTVKPENEKRRELLATAATKRIEQAKRKKCSIGGEAIKETGIKRSKTRRNKGVLKIRSGRINKR